MGLAQREFEAAGISTITLSPIPEFTASVSAPRIAAIDHPPGRAFGQPGDAPTQAAVLRATLGALRAIDAPGGTVVLPFQWPEPARRVRWHPQPFPPIATLCIRRPWNYVRLLNGDIPASD